MLPKRTGLFLVALLTGCHPEAPGAHSDYFEGCMAADGREYMVDANTSHCPPGDAAARCYMPTRKLIQTRGQEACRQKGGWPLGTKPIPAWVLEEPKNSK